MSLSYPADATAPHRPHAVRKSLHCAVARSPFTPRVIARASWVLMVGLSLWGALPHAASAADATPQAATAPAVVHEFNVAAGPLNQVLPRFAAAAGVQISADAALTTGVQSPGVHGTYTVASGFSALLTGTGLEAMVRGPGEYTLRKLVAAADAGVQLPATSVNADRDPGKTEGTGSYTTQSTAAATGLSLSLRDTPQSLTVITQQQIKDQNLMTLAQAMRNTPGIAVTSWDSERSFFNSRGFAVDNVQYDGVPTSLRNSFYGESNNDPIIYDRIEVVRGATGLMTGAGYPSASINLVRKRADSKTLAGEVTLGLGTWNRRRATFDLSTPLTEDGRIRARFVGMAQSKNAQYDFYHSNKQVFYGTIDADLTDHTTLTLGYDYQRNRPTGVTWGGLPLVFSDGTYTDWSTSKTMGTPWTYWYTTNQTILANLEHRFDNGWKARANFSHRQSNYDAKLFYVSGNIDRTTGTGLTPLPSHTQDSFQQNSIDVQASGPFTLFGRRHELVLGFSGSESHDILVGYARTSALQAVGNFYNWDGSYAEPTWGTGTATGDDRTRQTGWYGALRMSLSDRLKFILGGRESTWRLDSLTSVRRHAAFTPYAGAIYDVSEDFSVYASYTDIFLPQNYRDTSGNYLDPVTGTNYEVGVKGEHFGGRLNTSFALFRIKQDNVATRDGTNLVPGSTAYAYVGAKGVTSKGFEAQVSGEPVVGWNMMAGISRTLATQASGAPYNPDMPTTQIRLFTSWHLPGAWRGLTVGAGFSWQNRTYYTVSTSQAGNVMYVQKPVGVAEVMARYDFTPKVSLQLNINNLFDRKYLVYLAGQGTYAERVNAMATLTFRL